MRSVVDIDQNKLRLLLLEQQGQTITYGEVAKRLGFEWDQSVRGRLVAALDHLAYEDRIDGQALLSALVVTKATGLPGPGFFEKFFPEARTDDDRAATYERELHRLRSEAEQGVGLKLSFRVVQENRCLVYELEPSGPLRGQIPPVRVADPEVGRPLPESLPAAFARMLELLRRAGKHIPG